MPLVPRARRGSQHSAPPP